MTAKILGVLLSFPTEEHVKKTCKPGSGSNTCRYLTMSQGGWSCAKSSGLRSILDERVAKDTMKAKGDNCGGLLGIILKNQEELAGKKIDWEEHTPTYKESGVFQKMEINDGMLDITAFWDGRGEDSVSFSVTDLSISVMPRRIIFGIAGLGMFAGEAAINFD